MSESQIVASDRFEEQLLRGASDAGGTRRINGYRYDDWPSADEVGELA